MIDYSSRISQQRLLLRSKERGRIGRNLDKSADEIVDIQVASQLSHAQRQSVVDQRYYHPTTS